MSQENVQMVRRWLWAFENSDGRGGVPVDAPWGLICDFRGDEICCTRTSLDHGEALRAAGLSE